MSEYRDKAIRFTPRQLQALAKPCPTPAHIQTNCLMGSLRDCHTILAVTIDNGRICWHASVARFDPQTKAVIPLDQQSPRQLRELTEMGREMLYLRDGKGSVGTCEHYVVPETVSVRVVRQLTDAEKALLPSDWLYQPTDAEIRRQA